MKNISEAAKLLRYYSLTSTTSAGSGHPTSCLSAADLMATLFFGGNFRYDIENPDHLENDRLIFSKGHAAPLFYAMWAAAGAMDYKELSTLRQMGSRLEGHPTMKFPYTEVPTGSLGQGLGVGVGMAMCAKYLDKTDSRTYVLLGDSEMAEGSVWEAMEIAAHYKLDNLVAIVDVNRLGQRGETLDGHNLGVLEEKAKAFGWFPIVIDGHNVEFIAAAYKTAGEIKDKPTMILAKTFKGRGISLFEDKEGKHAKALSKEDLDIALIELGNIDTSKTFHLKKSATQSEKARNTAVKHCILNYRVDEKISTREAYGATIAELVKKNDHIVVLDAEVSNSTMSDKANLARPDRFFEMYLTEQNMVSMAQGFAKRNKIPFISSFASFLSRAHDQIRMGSYANCNIKIFGGYGGLTLGPDGASQMGLEDIAMFRATQNSVVLCPSDATSMSHLVNAAADVQGLTYIRGMRDPMSILYSADEAFPIGSFKIHGNKLATGEIIVISAGVTLHEALKAQKELAEKNVHITVIDLYSVKPIDTETLLKETENAKKIIVVEDHFEEGGIAEAVRSVIGNQRGPIISLAVRKMPCSGKPQELLRYEEIDSESIIKEIVS